MSNNRSTCVFRTKFPDPNISAAFPSVTVLVIMPCKSWIKLAELSDLFNLLTARQLYRHACHAFSSSRFDAIPDNGCTKLQGAVFSQKASWCKSPLASWQHLRFWRVCQQLKMHAGSHAVRCTFYCCSEVHVMYTNLSL